MNASERNELPPRPTALAQTLLAGLLKESDLAIDATAGNGHDTLFLAERVGETGQVLAFDVQEAAIEASRDKISEAGLTERVTFFRQSHARMHEHAAAATVAAVMFNLGYLPGADHAVTTGDDTLRALEAAACLLKPGGALSVVCYPGHEEGGNEAQAVEEWITSLPELGWRVAKYGAIGTWRPAPFLLFAVKGR